MRRLWLIQAVGNALLFWFGFTWLGIRDSKSWQLIETAILGLAILIPWLWLQDGTLAYCGDRSQGLGPAFRRAARTLAIFAFVVIVFALLFWGLGKLEPTLTTAGERTASWLTFHLRKPIKPATWVKIYLGLLWGARWIVLPAVFLPIAAGAAMNGARGMRLGGGRVFWLQYLVALLIGLYVPGFLIHWVPKLTGTIPQVLSFALRFGVAYVLLITMWLAVAFFAASGAAFRLPSQPRP
jgi:hypothetical protein